MDIGRPSYCPLHGDYGRGEEYERRNCPGCRNKASPTMEPYVSARKARLARIDATARAVLAAQFTTGEDSIHRRLLHEKDARIEDICAAAYRFALALERARAEAIKEIQ